MTPTPTPSLEDTIARVMDEHQGCVGMPRLIADALQRDLPPDDASDSPLYDAWCVIANARDWLIEDEQAEQWRIAAMRWRDRNGFGAAVAGPATPTGDDDD